MTTNDVQELRDSVSRLITKVDALHTEHAGIRAMLGEMEKSRESARAENSKDLSLIDMRLTTHKKNLEASIQNVQADVAQIKTAQQTREELRNMMMKVVGSCAAAATVIITVYDHLHR